MQMNPCDTNRATRLCLLNRFDAPVPLQYYPDRSGIGISGIHLAGLFQTENRCRRSRQPTMPHKVNPIDFENSGNLGIANAPYGNTSAANAGQPPGTDSTFCVISASDWRIRHHTNRHPKGAGANWNRIRRLASDLDQSWEASQSRFKP